MFLTSVNFMLIAQPHDVTAIVLVNNLSSLNGF